MKDSEIIENLLDNDPAGWETANLLQQHYAEIVHRRGTAHFDQLKLDLPRALREAIGGEWIVTIKGKLHKRNGFPLRIRNTNWPAKDGFVIGFEYKQHGYRGDACFGLIHNPVLPREERLARYPDQILTPAPGYHETRWWLAAKIITELNAPDFVSTMQLVKWTSELMSHYDSANGQIGNGWLSQLCSGRLD